MKIAVEAASWHNRRGYGRHTRSLLGALAELAPHHELEFISDGDCSEIQLDQRVKVIGVTTSEAAVDALRAGGNRSILDLWKMSRALSDPKYDVLIFPTICNYVPVSSRATKIVFQHDAIVEEYPELTTSSHKERLFWDAKVRLAQLQADHLVTVSEFSKSILAKRFPQLAKRIEVVGEASDPAFHKLDNPALTDSLRATSIRWDRPIVLYVGGISPHKNLIRLAEAFAIATAAEPWNEAQLVFVGATNTEKYVSCFDQLRGACLQHKIAERVVFTGYLSDQDLNILYNRATVLAMPSLMEGFGLPAVEAAAAGCPVIATKNGATREVLGDASLYVDPLSTAEIAKTLDLTLRSESLRSRMSVQGREAAQKLTWAAAAKTLLDLIERQGRAPRATAAPFISTSIGPKGPWQPT
jgi:glycosyltransferase involved in cell wall biosynthesis